MIKLISTYPRFLRKSKNILVKLFDFVNDARNHFSFPQNFIAPGAWVATFVLIFVLVFLNKKLLSIIKFCHYGGSNKKSFFDLIGRPPKKLSFGKNISVIFRHIFSYKGVWALRVVKLFPSSQRKKAYFVTWWIQKFIFLPNNSKVFFKGKRMKKYSKIEKPSSERKKLLFVI